NGPVKIHRTYTDHLEFRLVKVRPKIVYCSIIPRSEHAPATSRMLFIGKHLAIHVGPVEGIYEGLADLPAGSKSRVWNRNWFGLGWLGFGLVWAADSESRP